MGFDLYASHLPILVAVASKANGNFLEIGAGYYSTPVLHAIAAVRGIELTTVETNQLYYYMFADLITNTHGFIVVKQSTDYKIEDYDRWGMAFIDNDDCPRADLILKLRDKCRYIVAHDTENLKPNYGFDRLDGAFQYRIDFKFKRYQIEPEIIIPWTSVFSDTENLDWIRKAFPENGEQ